MAAHILFIYMYPVFPLVLLGLSYSCFGAIVWPVVAYLVPEKNLVKILFNFRESHWVY